jgi:hypothetical protein
MKWNASVVTALAMAGVLWSKSAGAEASAPLVHVRNSFDLIVDAPYERAAPLFGPNGERAWAGKHWDPQFLYPQPGRDVEGAIFTVNHGEHTVIWVTTSFDLKAKHFAYVYFIPDVMVTTIDVTFALPSTDKTAVHVVYVRTALRPEGNEDVQRLGEQDRISGKEWETAISSYLKQQ